MINFFLEYHFFLIVVIVVMPCILICSNILQHTLNENKKIIKQKFEYVSLTTNFFLSIIEIFFSFYLFSLCFEILIEALKQEIIFLIIFLFIIILILIINIALLLSSIFFLKHLYFEATRNIYYSKDNNTIIIIKNKEEITIDLNNTNYHLSIYTTSLRKFPGNIGKYIFEIDDKKINISKILNLSPDLEDLIMKMPNKKIITKNLNWI